MSKQSKYNRVFVAEFEYMEQWTNGYKHAIKTSTNDDDFYLVFRTGKQITEGPELKKLIDLIDDHMKLFSCEDISDSDYIQFVLNTVLGYAGENTCVYFLLMDELYAELKDRLEDKVQYVASHKNFRVGRGIKNRGRKKINEMDKKNKNRERKSEEDLFAGLTNLTEGVNPGINIPYENPSSEDEIADRHFDGQIRSESEEWQANSTDSASENNRNDSSVDTHKENEKNNSINKNVKNNHSNSMPEDLQKESDNSLNSKDKSIKNDTKDSQTADKASEKASEFSNKSRTDRANPAADRAGSSMGVGSRSPVGGPSRMQKPNMQRRGPQGPSPYDNTSMQDIEDLIFQQANEIKVDKKQYTKLENDEIQVTIGLFERLVSNINKFARGIAEYGFDDSAYNKLIVTFVKAENYDDFVNSWNCTMPGKPVNIDEKIYESIKKEAMYYNKVCQMFMIHDKWK